MNHLKYFENFAGYGTEEGYEYAKQKVDELELAIKNEFGVEVIWTDKIEIEWKINDITFEASYNYDEEDEEYGDNFYVFGWTGADVQFIDDDGAGQWDTDDIQEIIEKIKEII
jgi:hypothetical protein